MALFTVPHSTSGFFKSAGPTALAGALECNHRTVKRVRIPVHGAPKNLSALVTQPTRPVGAINNGVPGRRLHSAPRRTTVGVQPTLRPWALRAATQGIRARRPAAGEQAPH